MAQTFTIPLTTFQPDAPVTVGPYNLKQQDNQANITIDRTVAGGLDETLDTTLTMTFEASTNGGQSWGLLTSCSLPGGPMFYTDKQGVQHQYATAFLMVGTDLVKGAQIRAIVTATGAPVAIAGTVNFTS